MAHRTFKEQTVESYNTENEVSRKRFIYRKRRLRLYRKSGGIL